MSEKKKLPNIRVETLPNGYAMKVEGYQYMMFSPMALLEEMMMRVGVGEMKYFDRTFLRNVMTAVAVWPTIEEATTAIANQMEITDNVRSELRAARHEAWLMQQDKEQWMSDKRKMGMRLAEAERALKETDALRVRCDKTYKLYQTECKKTIKLERELYEMRSKVRELEARCKRNDAVRETRKKRTREQIEADNFSDRETDPKHTKP